MVSSYEVDNSIWLSNFERLFAMSKATLVVGSASFLEDVTIYETVLIS